MNKSDWLKFTWNLKTVPAVAPSVPEHYQLRLATKDEEKSVLNVARTAFGLDSAWTHLLKQIDPLLTEKIEDIFDSKDSIDCVVLTHGVRIIGVSILDADASAEYQLFTGPLVLGEYRSRGLGGLLLQESLRVLAEKGLSKACGITPKAGVAARFIYPKFDAVSEPSTFEVAVLS